MRSLIPFLFAGVVMSAPAFAQDDGIPVTVQVLDIEGEPIKTATIRHPEEAERHRVNSANGEWVESILYLQDGSEFKFTKGKILKLEVSAPGYINQTVDYTVRKRKNRIPVILEKMEMPEDDGELDITIQFGRDKPRD